MRGSKKNAEKKENGKEIINKWCWQENALEIKIKKKTTET